jgi:Flp pilus assembly protein TadG
MLKRIFGIALIVLVTGKISAQEIQARLTVITSRISTRVDKKIFTTLQTQLTNFINNRKWSNDTYQPNEKIQCNFLLNIDQEKGNNVYSAKLTVQAARPVYNTTYDSPLINFIDDDVTFR